jgi:hypothetical protein
MFKTYDAKATSNQRKIHDFIIIKSFVLQRILSQIEKTICTMGEKIYKPYI